MPVYRDFQQLPLEDRLSIARSEFALRTPTDEREIDRMVFIGLMNSHRDSLVQRIKTVMGAILGPASDRDGKRGG